MVRAIKMCMGIDVMRWPDLFSLFLASAFPYKTLVSSLPSVASSKLTSRHCTSPTHTGLLFPEGSNQSSTHSEVRGLRVGHVPLPTVTVIGQTWVVSPPLESEWVNPIGRVAAERREDESLQLGLLPEAADTPGGKYCRPLPLRGNCHDPQACLPDILCQEVILEHQVGKERASLPGRHFPSMDLVIKATVNRGPRK